MNNNIEFKKMGITRPCPDRELKRDYCGWGQGGRRLGEKGKGGVREAGEEGAGSRRKRENYTTLHNTLQ